MIVDTPLQNRRSPVHLSDKCPCGGSWSVVQLNMNERMDLRIGRYWVAQCSDCRQYSVAYTFKQEQAMRGTNHANT
jgi:hypothetical protein